jgi:glycosyltransferase involved in cell wall biosynthesis
MSLPLRVLHVIDSLAVGGAERVLVDLANTIDRQVVIPSVCVTRAGDMTLERELRSDVIVEQLLRTKTLDIGSMRRFAQILAEQAIDLIHAHGYSSSRFALIARLFSRTRPPLVLHAHSSDPPDRTTRLIARFGVRHVIGVSPEIVGWAHSMLGVTSATLIGNALDPQPYQEAKPAEISQHFAQRPRLIGVVVANVRPVKDFETLFTALARSQHSQEIGILVAGSTSDEAYVAHCRRLLELLGIANQVIFLGRRHDVPELLAAADLGVLSSRRESGPLALLEYMAAGLPFVTTQVGHVGESAAKAGLPGTVPPGDSIAFAATLDTLAALETNERQQRGAEGCALVLRHFTRGTQIEQVQALYRSVYEGIHDERLSRARRA